MDLSIVIPTLNCVATLGSTLLSLQPLRAAGCRVILADSFSKDGTRELAGPFIDALVDVAPGNLYAAVNAGVRNSAGGWATYINGDDVLYADAVMSAYQQFQARSDVIYGDIDFIDGAGTFLHSLSPPREQDLLGMASSLINPVFQQGTLFRREVFDRLDGFDVRYRFSSDFDFFLRAKLAKFRFQRVRYPPLAAFRVHSKQLTQVYGDVEVAEAQEALERNGISVSGTRRFSSRLRYRLQNLPCYLVRWLRSAQIVGRYSPRRCMEIDPGKKGA